MTSAGTSSMSDLHVQIRGQSHHKFLSDGDSEADGMEENYQFINECSDYNDNILILVECRKKSEDEMRSTGSFENKSDHYYQAILIDKNFDDDQVIFRARENKINTPESVLRVLFDWSCKEVAKKIDSEPGAICKPVGVS